MTAAAPCSHAAAGRASPQQGDSPVAAPSRMRMRAACQHAHGERPGVDAAALVPRVARHPVGNAAAAPTWQPFHAYASVGDASGSDKISDDTR